MVFKNCAKSEPKNKVRTHYYHYQLMHFSSASLIEQEKNFINDTIRSEFHRKFMDKYVK